MDDDRKSSIEQYHIAVKAFRKGEYHEASDFLSYSLFYDPNNIEAWFAMAKVWNEYDYDSKERVMAYCYRRILDIDPSNKKALAAIRRLEPTYLDDNEVLRSASHQRIANLQDLIRQSPKSGNLYFELATVLLTAEPIFMGVADSDSGFWRRIDTTDTSFSYETVLSNRSKPPRLGLVIDLGPFSSQMAEARDHLNLALALGLTNLLDQAKARFLLILLNSCKSRMVPQRAVKADTGNKALARDVISEVKKYLRRYPHHVEALNIQREAYKILENRDGEGRTEQALEQALILERAGLSVASPDKSESKLEVTSDRPGEALEQQVKILMQSMGLRAVAATGSADGGIDVVAYSEHPIFGGKYIVQCKDWDKPVGVSIVRDLYGVVMSENANKGILITTGRFTSAAEQFAEGKQLELIEGTHFQALLSNHD